MAIMERMLAVKALQLVVIGVLLSCTAGSSVCLSCQDVISPAACNKVKSCGTHEECYSDAFTTPNGYIHFNLGCRDTRMCTGQQIVVGRRSVKGSTTDRNPLLETRSQNDFLCSQCCSGDLCNHKLCGQKPFSSYQGPVCYACHLQGTQNSCDSIVHCYKDQVCQLTFIYDQTLQRLVYTTGCRSPSECEANKTAIQQTACFLGTCTGKQNLDCHVKCCNSSLCNNCANNETAGSSTTKTTMSTPPPPPTTVSTTKPPPPTTTTVSTTTPTTTTVPTTTSTSTTTTVATTTPTTTTVSATTPPPTTTTVSTTTPPPPTRTTVPITTQTITVPTTLTTQPSPINPALMPIDCKDIKDNPGKFSYNGTGVYTVKLAVSGRTLQVHCDMDTDGGRWTIFQRRFSNNENFNRTFQDYENGFGDINKEFWLGLSNVWEMIGSHGSQLKVTYNYTDTGYIILETDTLSGFRLGPPPEYRRYFDTQTYFEYTETPAPYNIRKGLDPEYHNGSAFVTHDRDNLQTCGSRFGTGNWFPDCTCRSELNPVYDPPYIIVHDATASAPCSSTTPPMCAYEPWCAMVDPNASRQTQQPGVGIRYHLKDVYYPLLSTTMMFRRT